MAAALTVVLTAIVLGSVTTVLRQWARSTGRLGAAAQARLVFDRLAQDLEGAIPDGRGRVALAVTVLPDTRLSGRWQPAAVPTQGKPDNSHAGSLNLGAARLEDLRFGVAGVWLRLFSVKADSEATAADLSAPVAVGYQIVRQQITSSATAPRRYLLFRAEVRRTRTAGGSPGTFEAGYDLDPDASPATPYMTPNATAGDPGNLIRPPLGSVLADNVIDFGVRLYVREGDVWRLVFPAQASVRGGAPAAGRPTAAFPPSAETEHLARAVRPSEDDHYRHAFPALAEVMIRVLTEEGARLMAAYEAGLIRPPAGMPAGDYWWMLAEANSEVFTQRIQLPARPI